MCSQEKNLTMDEIHNILLEMLYIIDDICRENHITYFLSGGTAIGAIREKGFIPWDDDLDIMLPRDDYERLIELLEKENYGRYKAFSLHDASWNRPYSCLVDEKTYAKHEYVNYSHLGVTVDILPIDGLPSALSRVKRYYAALRMKYALYYSSMKVHFSPYEKLKPLKRFVAIFTRKIGAHKMCVQIDNKARKLAFNQCDYVGCSVLIHFMEKEWFKKVWFREQIYVPFENGHYPVMNGYDEYLTALYGDYMKRPDQERDPDHHTSYYWK